MNEDKRQENGKDYIIRHLTFFPFNVKFAHMLHFVLNRRQLKLKTVNNSFNIHYLNTALQHKVIDVYFDATKIFHNECY